MSSVKNRGMRHHLHSIARKRHGADDQDLAESVKWTPQFIKRSSKGPRLTSSDNEMTSMLKLNR